MFRTNESHRQRGIFDVQEWLPESLRARLADSWAATFYHEVFCRIDEAAFAPLYSDDQASRPNVSVNVLVGLEILKSGFGWSDEELLDQVAFNMQVRHALGLDDLRRDLFTVRTLYNFRRRVREYAAETGINLFQGVFEQVADEQLETLALATGWQRMDSTQVLSNLANLSRLELLIAVLQAVYAALHPAAQTAWADEVADYLQGRPQQVSYRLKASATADHLQQIGEWLVAWEAELAREAPESDALALVRRVLHEQYRCTAEGAVTLRPAAEVASDSLQSPHDLEATYRVKGGRRYRGGYVANVSETVDPDNAVQLITAVQVEPNCTDDSTLLAQSLAGQTAREIEVERLTTDGGYTGPEAEAACETYDVELRPTRLRGGRSAAEHYGWEDYRWQVDAEGHPVQVTCPEGETAAVKPGRGTDCYLARFDRARCAACPYYQQQCRVQPRTHQPPTLYVKGRAVTVALQRQRLCPEDRAVRAAVEATVRSVKRAFPGSKLPVRGLTRARMLLYGAALMVNLRRVHRYVREQGSQVAQNAATFVRQVERAVAAGAQRLRALVARHFTLGSVSVCSSSIR